jgi:hypothetical protein
MALEALTVQHGTAAPIGSRRRPKEFQWSILRVPIAIAAGYMLLTTKVDPDLFGHLRFGLDILRSGHLSSGDPYSWTSDMLWTNHEWLSELTMAFAYSTAGIGGLVVMKGLVAAVAVFVIMTATRSASSVWRWPAALLAILAMVPVYLTIRPQIWTMLFLTLTCWILTSSWKRRYWLPLIFLLWANLHGGWLVGIGVVGVWSAIELFDPEDSRPPRWFVVAIPIACLVSTLVNPYGWHLWEFLGRTVRLSRPDIIEWQPLWRASAGSIAFWVAALLWAGLAIRFAETRPLKAIAAVAILAYASLRVLRIVPLLAPAAVILLLPYVRQHRDRSLAAGPTIGGTPKLVVDFICACIGFVMVAWPVSPGCVRMAGDWIPDFGAARAISAANLRGRLVNSFNWGEYAIWHFGPQLKVSMDGRRETVYSEHVIGEQHRIAGGESDALANLQALSPEYAWLPVGKTTQAKTWFASHGYRIDVSTPQSFVAVRKDLPRVAAVAATASPPCFPGL